MKKPEAEKAIRSLCHTWAATLSPEGKAHPSFAEFRRWLSQSGYGDYMNFRSTEGAGEAAEAWFDQELGQMWRR